MLDAREGLRPLQALGAAISILCDEIAALPVVVRNDRINLFQIHDLFNRRFVAR